MLLALHKPYGVLSQFTPDAPGQRTLAEFGFPTGVYPLGRLDLDSEGLLLLSDEAGLNARLLDPRGGHRRTYWVQVDGVVTDEALRRLADGVTVQGKPTRHAKAWRLDPAPGLPSRDPPIRHRLNVPTSWLALELTEGRNRQVRRMTAAVEFPTLRLFRARIGDFDLSPDLAPGAWRELNNYEREAVFRVDPFSRQN
ncbi:pseudouridine synthase [Verrucomicrobia bacterium SCGC AG-212-E04]|nr:pseudouridine synthase [Verrucomicrobia bacterium SCGC AG-212-E04]